MTSAERQRIQAYCEIIWGKGDYDVDVETDDRETYYGVVKRGFWDGAWTTINYNGDMLFKPASMERAGQNARCLGQAHTDRTDDVKRADIEYIWWTQRAKQGSPGTFSRCVGETRDRAEWAGSDRHYLSSSLSIAASIVAQNLFFKYERIDEVGRE